VAKVEVIQCDLQSCGKMAAPAEDGSIPPDWLMADYYQQGEGSLEGRVFCSWTCVSQWASNRVAVPKKRTRRTRAQIEADKAAVSA
jgi:hypothetical protein